MRDDFAIFILSHGRPKKVTTLNTLKSTNYKGKIYIVIDNEDKTADEYIKKFGDKVLIFDKQKKSKEFDTADLPSRDRRSVVYARNACFDFAKKLGLKYFLELDDDYDSFQYRYEKNGKLREKKITLLNELIALMISFLDETKATTVALSQGGDFIGGLNGGGFKKGLLRKAMNTFFLKTENRFDFVGRINEDVNTYTALGHVGRLFFSTTKAMVTQETTQASKGGMTELYLNAGTYVKSFYSIIFSPSCVKIALMGDKMLRIHHNVLWEHCTPKIINERYKKQ